MFSLVTDFIPKKLDMRSNVSARLKQCLDHADIVLTEKTTSAFIETFDKLKKQSVKFGLTNNDNKTKCLNHNRFKHWET